MNLTRGLVRLADGSLVVDDMETFLHAAEAWYGRILMRAAEDLAPGDLVVAIDSETVGLARSGPAPTLGTVIENCGDGTVVVRV